MAWSQLVERSLANGSEGYKSIKCVFNLPECVADADYIQESVAEDLHVKQSILEEIDEFAPSNAIVGSSTSYIPLSLLRARAKRHPERIAIAHPSLPHWDAFCEVLGSNELLTQWLTVLYGQGSDNIVGLGMDVVFLKRESHGHVFNLFFELTWTASSCLAGAGVANAADIDKALVHFARCIIAGNGLSGLLAGLVGGGSVVASTDLVTDIAMGWPLGQSAVIISRLVPKIIAWRILWLAQKFLLPFRLCKQLVNRMIIKMNRPFAVQFTENQQKVPDFKQGAIRRMCSLEDHALKHRDQ